MTGQVEDLEPTRQSLLVRLKNWEDQTGWLDFFTKYWRLIYSVARRSGLSRRPSYCVTLRASILADYRLRDLARDRRTL